MSKPRWIALFGFVAGVLPLIVAGAAHASLPKSLAHRDPAAPCFRWPAVDMDQDGVFDRVDRCPSTETGCIVDAYGCSLDGDADGVCDGRDRCPGTPPGTRVNAEGCPEAQALHVPPKPPSSPPLPRPAAPPPSKAERQLMEKALIRIEDVHFETGSAKLLAESQESLKDAGAALEKYPELRVEVEGHTDTRGGAHYNLSLSQMRAEAVRAYLLEHFRLRPENVTAQGYGESRPETEERSPEELLMNRRVVLRVLNPQVLPKGVEMERKE